MAHQPKPVALAQLERDILQSGNDAAFRIDLTACARDAGAQATRLLHWKFYPSAFEG
jgi:hypothetical protein